MLATLLSLYVAERFGDAEAHSEGDNGSLRGKAKFLLANQWNHGAFKTNHAADKRVGQHLTDYLFVTPFSITSPTPLLGAFSV